MRKIQLPSDKKIYLAFIVFFVILVFILPRAPKFSYDYRKGTEWKYGTLVSQFDFPIYKTEEQIEEERSNAEYTVVPYYRYSGEIVNRNIKSVEGIQSSDFSIIRAKTVNCMRSIYSQGVVPDELSRADRRSTNLSSELLFIQKDKRAIKYPVSEILKQSDARAKLLADVSAAYYSVNVDSVFREVGVYDLLVPNLIFDRQTTELVHSEIVKDVSPTQGFVSAGQLIVAEGEIVTAEISQMLDSYKKEYESNYGYNGPDVLMWLGNIILALAIAIALFLVILLSSPSIFSDINRTAYLIFIVIITTLSALLVGNANEQLLYLVPFTLPALYLQAFFNNREAAPIYLISLLPLLMVTHVGPVLYVMFAAAGLTSIYTFRLFATGWKQFISAAISFLVLLLVFCGFKLVQFVAGSIYLPVLFLFIGSILSVAFYSLVFLFEKIFNLVSASRLIELADTNNTLLRELEDAAPGTFQHSLQVMNMADAVARALNANIELVRAGALYHDIGKMANPECFIENQSLIHQDGTAPYHASLTAEESAGQIISHVADGLAIAERYHLPEVVKSFISSHHGTTETSYFYNKFINEGGSPSSVALFRYPGPAPVTREQVILMMCDSIEAASRTLQDNSPEGYSDFVEKIVEGKINAGQLYDSEMSMKDLNIMKDVIKSYLPKMYHERIAYPGGRRVKRNFNQYSK